MNTVARRTPLWADARSNKYCGSWRCNIVIGAAASRFQMVLHTRSGRHNCPCPSYTAQNPQKTNTTVCEVLGPVRASEMRVNRLAWLYYVAYGRVPIAMRRCIARARKLASLFPDKVNWNYKCFETSKFIMTERKERSFIVFDEWKQFIREIQIC